MRRFLVLIMLCLLPLQISWAAVIDHCGHEPGKAGQHFGHHDDEHKAFSEKSDPEKFNPEKFNSDKQSGKPNLGHDHCHMSGFLGLLHVAVAHVPVPPTLPSLHCDERIRSSLALDRPERPKWRVLA